MARFAGSGETAKFIGPGNNVRSKGGFGAAAGMTDVAGIFEANRQRAPRFDRMSANNMKKQGSRKSRCNQSRSTSSRCRYSCTSTSKQCKNSSGCCS